MSRPQPDPLTKLLENSAPPSQTASETAATLQSLTSLASAHKWADVLQHSTNLLSSEQHPPHESLSIQTFRALALLQTGQIQRATDAVSSLGDLSDRNPVHRYDNYEIYDTAGSFVPFLLRLLALELRLRGDGVAAIPDAYKLAGEVVGAEKEAVLSVLTRHLLRFGLHDTAIDVTEQLVALRGGDAESLFTLSRLHLLLHDVESAWVALSRARRAGATEEATAVHRGMLLAAEGKYEEALNEYERAVDGEGWVVAMNNSAVCLLQLGRLDEAVDRLEEAVGKDPYNALDEGLVFNLATLNQLKFPDALVEKKRVLRRLVEKFGRQGFDLEGVGL